LRHVVFGGEALDVSSLKPWFEVFGDQQPRLINMYGITETTVHVTYRPITQADLAKGASSPIGEVIPDL
ncbi:AMP-binding protein, partial [Pseudomonas putida]|uniref:AMP-binding protein n=1 Tax=Pseudomonas putida TaxID=303 RepID=UPI0024E12235